MCAEVCWILFLYNYIHYYNIQLLVRLVAALLHVINMKIIILMIILCSL